MEPIQGILAHKDPDFFSGLFPRSRRHEQYLGALAIDRAHRQFLEVHNGLYAFSRALHIFGCSDEMAFHDMETRNRSSQWRQLYGETAAGLAFFAEEVLGNLFAYSEEGIVFFDVESAESEMVADDFIGWVRYILEDVDYTTGRSLAQAWFALHGPIPFGSHLCPKRPFIIGGEYEVDNLFLAPWNESLLFKADIARQIRDLPDGTEIEIDLGV